MMKNKNRQYDHPEVRNFTKEFGEDLTPVFRDENSVDSSRIFTDESRGTASDNQHDSSSYALKLKAIKERIFTDESRSSAPSSPAAQQVPPKQPDTLSYGAQLAAIERIFTDESRNMPPTYGDKLAALPQIFSDKHETNAIVSHGDRLERVPQVSRDESNGPLPNIQLDLSGYTTSQNQPVAAGAEPAPAEPASDPNAETKTVAQTTPQKTAEKTDQNESRGSRVIDISTRQKVGNAALTGLIFTGLFAASRYFGPRFLNRAK